MSARSHVKRRETVDKSLPLGSHPCIANAYTGLVCLGRGGSDMRDAYIYLVELEKEQSHGELSCCFVAKVPVEVSAGQSGASSFRSLRLGDKVLLPADPVSVLFVSELSEHGWLNMAVLFLNGG